MSVCVVLFQVEVLLINICTVSKHHHHHYWIESNIFFHHDHIFINNCAVKGSLLFVLSLPSPPIPIPFALCMRRPMSWTNIPFLIDVIQWISEHWFAKSCHDNRYLVLECLLFLIKHNDTLLIVVAVTPVLSFFYAIHCVEAFWITNCFLFSLHLLCVSQLIEKKTEVNRAQSYNKAWKEDCITK